MNYPDSVQFLYSLGNEIKTAKFGLERIRTVLDALARPQDRLRFVHVAGTNGKGSVCAMLESGLRAAGQKTGLFISPHLEQPTERICINGEPVSFEQFSDAFNHVHRKVEDLLAAQAIDFHTSYFETVTAMALLIFEQEQVDRVVLEVGLGGRLDATNVVTPELCVITPIDFDHEAFLGKSIESIAGEKAGILKPNVPAVISGQRTEAGDVLRRRAAELHVPLIDAAQTGITNLALDARGSHYDLATAPPVHVDCPLAGEHQVANSATAAVALLRLGVPGSTITAGIAAAHWPGRLERISEQPEIILDGAHNPAGARALAAYIERFYRGRRIRLIFGAMRDKSIEELTGILFPLADEVIVTAPRQQRAITAEAVREIADHPRLTTAPDIQSALAQVRDAAPNEAVFITGSLFLVAEARAALRK